MIVCIWIIALSSTIPWALFFQLVPISPQAPEIQLCLEVWPPGTDGKLYFLLANLVACYLLPMTLITICYILIWIKVGDVFFIFLFGGKSCGELIGIF